MSSPRLARFRAGMQGLVDAGRLVSLSTIIARHGRIVSFETYGQLDLTRKTPTPEDAIFFLASMTKPVTGVAMLLLYEEGKWRLDQPVTDHLPELDGLIVLNEDGSEQPAHRPPTMRELMSHSAGFSYGLFPDTAVDARYARANVLDPDVDLQGLVTKVASLPLAYQPGTNWRYSIAVDLQAACIERMMDTAFDEFLQAHIFEPLAMSDTGFFVSPENGDRLATVYTYDETGAVVDVPTGAGSGLARDPFVAPKLLSGGGGLFSTTADYWRFAQMLGHGGELDGTRLLAPGTVALMCAKQLPDGVEMTPIGPNAFPGETFGLDVAIVEQPPLSRLASCGHGTYWWAGAAGTWFWVDPANDVVFIALAHPPLIEAMGLASALVYQALVDPSR